MGGNSVEITASPLQVIHNARPIVLAGVDAVDGSSAGIAMCQYCGVLEKREGGAIHGTDYHDWSGYRQERLSGAWG
jgi:IMP dehydrogenase/GMP reductase